MCMCVYVYVYVYVRVCRPFFLEREGGKRLIFKARMLLAPCTNIHSFAEQYPDVFFSHLQVHIFL